MTTMMSTSVVAALKKIFSTYGILEVLMSDNGPQYISSEMKAFVSSYGFEHITSSPHYPQTNDQAERTVKIVKAILE